MKTSQLSKNDIVGIAIVKIALLFLPRIVTAPFYDANKHHALFGLTLIAGVLLQALVPPRKKGFLPALTFAIAFTVVYSVF